MGIFLSTFPCYNSVSQDVLEVILQTVSRVARMKFRKNYAIAVVSFYKTIGRLLSRIYHRKGGQHTHMGYIVLILSKTFHITVT